MNSESNPTLPLAYDLGWMAVVVAWLALTGIAWVSICRSPHSRVGGKLWWCLFVFAVPVIGALLWFWPRQRHKDARS